MKKAFLRAAAALMLALALLAGLPLAAGAGVVSPTEMFYVYDGANVLGEATEATIVYNNDALYEACGAQIVIVTVQSTGTMDISDYAYKLFDEWGIGSAEKNNGVLILLEIGAEDYWYLQGSGIERNLSTGDLAVLADRYLEPDFAAGDYDAGVAKLFEQLFARVANIYGAAVSYHAVDGFEDGSYGIADPQPIAQTTARPTVQPSATRTPVSTGRRGSFLGRIFKWILVFMAVNFVLGLLRRRNYRRRGLSLGTIGFFLLRPWRIFTRRRTSSSWSAPTVPPRPTGASPHSGVRKAGWVAGAGASAVKNIIRSAGSKSGGSGWSSGSRSFGGGRSFSGSRSSGGFSRGGGGGVSRGGGGGRRR